MMGAMRRWWGRSHRKGVALAAVVAVTVTLAGCGGDDKGDDEGDAKGKGDPEGKALFSDDFDQLGDSWLVADYPPDVNEEKQAYTPDNVTTEDGMLRITAEQRQVGDRAYASGLVSTAGRFSFTYGTVEWRAKVPKGKGVWPAAWLLGQDCAETFQNRSQRCPTWPAPGSQELDVIEVRGSRPTELHMAHHHNPEPGETQNFFCDWDAGEDLSQDFHTYSMEWTRDHVAWLVDGTERCRTEDNVPSTPMFLIINLAVGGVFDGDPDQSTTFPQIYLVDHVRVTQPT